MATPGEFRCLLLVSTVAEVAVAEAVLEGLDSGGPPADLAAAAADIGFFFAPRKSAGAGVGTGGFLGSRLGAMVV